MIDKFKLLKQSEPAPEELKGQVFQTLETMVLLADIFDLFTAKYTMSELEFLDTIQDTSELKDDEEKEESL